VTTDGLTTGFREWGKANGYRRKGITLHRDQAETIAVVNLQGSQWGGRYYVNVSLWLKALGAAYAPPENKCHIRTRLTTLDPGASLAEALVMTSPVDDASRGETLRASLDAFAEPWLRLASSVDHLKVDGRPFLDKCLVNGQAQSFLSRS
jgi:hypothetical protein